MVMVIIHLVNARGILINSLFELLQPMGVWCVGERGQRASARRKTRAFYGPHCDDGLFISIAATMFGALASEGGERA